MTSGRGNLVSTKTWSPAVPLKRQDNIISSDYARAARVFIPSYESECRPCMEQLIAFEYQRIWWIERDAWLKKPGNLPIVKPSSVNLEGKAPRVNKSSVLREKMQEKKREKSHQASGKKKTK